MLSKEKIEQIELDSKKEYVEWHSNYDEGRCAKAYRRGATAEAEKAQCLIEALESIIEEEKHLKLLADSKGWNYYPPDCMSKATAVLQSYTNSLK